MGETCFFNAKHNVGKTMSISSHTTYILLAHVYKLVTCQKDKFYRQLMFRFNIH